MTTQVIITVLEGIHQKATWKIGESFPRLVWPFRRGKSLRGEQNSPDAQQSEPDVADEVLSAA